MVQKKTRIALIALAALALPAGAAAQETQMAAPPAQPAAPAATPQQQEVEQIAQRLGALRQQASQDPAIQPLAAEVNAAMDRVDPGAKAKRDRADALRAEVQAAQAAGDNARLNTLAQEATQLQQYFGNLRPRLAQDAAFVEKQQAFTAAVVARMTELDPETPTLMARLRELRSGGAAQPAPAAPAPRQ